MLATRAADASCALVYVNQVGGQDELVFDGASLVFDRRRRARRPGAAVRGGRRSWSTSTSGPCSASGCSTRGAASTTPPLPEVDLTDRSVADEDAPSPRPLHPRSTRSPRCTRRLSSARATTCARTASPTSCSGCPVASTRRSWPASPWTPWAPSTCTAWRCRRGTRARGPGPTPRELRRGLGIELPHDRHRARLRGVARACWRRRSTGGRPTSPRRTCRAGSAAMLLMAPVEQVRAGWCSPRGNKSEMAVGYSTLYGDTGRWLRRDQGRVQDAGLRALRGTQPEGRTG